MVKTLLDPPARSPNAAALPAMDDPFFIVGAPRSGTTLLRTMFNAHPRICVPHETEFFMRVPPSRDAATLRRSLQVYTESVPFRQQELDASRVLVRALKSGPEGRAAVFVEMMRLHAARSGKPRIGEKSPHHYRHVEAIARELPGAKFIHICRDVRDVAASGLLACWSSRSAIVQAKSWRNTIREHFRLMAAMPADRYCEVRFESLIAQPECELRRLCAFLGEQFHPDMLRFDQRARAAIGRHDAAWSGSTPTALDSSAVGRHRSRLSDRQLHAVQRMASAEMSRMGYESAAVRFRPWWPALDAAERATHTLGKMRASIAKRLPSLLFDIETDAAKKPAGLSAQGM